MTRQTALLLILSTLLLSGCFGSRTSLSALRMDRPKMSSNQYVATSKLGFGFGFGFGFRHEVELTETRSTRALIEDVPNDDLLQLDPVVDYQSAEAFASLGLTVFPKLELSLCA